MQVKLIAKTDSFVGSGEELVSYIARVSNPENQSNKETAPRLLKYLINNKHWSPFEHVFMTVEITTSRAIAAQILRHRSFVFQEFSQRYSKSLEQELTTARRQDKKNRQNSIDDLSEDTKNWFNDAQDSVWKLSYDLYNKALDLGIAKECARYLLPLNTQTVIYMSGSLRSWFHYIDLRSANGTQLEHQLIALEIKKIFIENYPTIGEALWSTNLN